MTSQFILFATGQYTFQLILFSRKAEARSNRFHFYFFTPLSNQQLPPSLIPMIMKIIPAINLQIHPSNGQNNVNIIPKPQKKSAAPKKVFLMPHSFLFILCSYSKFVSCFFNSSSIASATGVLLAVNLFTISGTMSKIFVRPS